MSGHTLWSETRKRRQPVLRVHVRRDSEGMWFWYHWTCRRAEVQIGTFDEARESALAHNCGSPRPAEKPLSWHIEVDCDRNRLSASWLCPDCKQYCASHTPCDCCFDTRDD